jgi:ABC-type Na+ efflux pump permease subunit
MKNKDRIVVIVFILLAILGMVVVSMTTPGGRLSKHKPSIVKVDVPKQGNPPVAVASTNGFRIEGLNATPTFAK